MHLFCCWLWCSFFASAESHFLALRKTFQYPRHTSLKLQPPSVEQSAIVETILAGKSNVKVNAVAGSGKTTTILHIAKNTKDPVLALLYNARLKEETRQKAKELELGNLEAHSYHAFGVKYYLSEAKTDTGLERIAATNVPPRKRFDFKYIVLDEVQDLTPDLYRFVLKLMRDNVGNFTLLLIGDAQQNVFQFRHSDERYLSMGAVVFKDCNAKPWTHMDLSTTFRLTGNMGKFMNSNVLHFNKFVTVKPAGYSIDYYIGSQFDTWKKVAKQLIDFLKSGTYAPGDIFLLAPSVTVGRADRLTPLNQLTNYLQTQGYPCHVPTNDDAASNRHGDQVRDGKILLSTFVSCKGLERKVAVIFNFDANYFTFYDKESNPNVCPNTLYVALTRATERLILIGEETKNGHLPFLKCIDESEYVRIHKVGNLTKTEPPKSTSKPTVSQLVKFLPEHVCRSAMAYIRTKEVSRVTVTIALPSLVQTRPGMWEEVSELTGGALPALHEQMSTGSNSSMQKWAVERLREAQKKAQKKAPISGGEADFSRVALAEVDRPHDTHNVSQFLRLAAISAFVNNGFVAKPYEIKDYTWVTDSKCKEMLAVLNRHLPPGTAEYETEVELKTTWPLGESSGLGLTVTGMIDAWDHDDAIWELKCTGSIEDTHLLQLALYGWLLGFQDQATGAMASRPEAQGKREIKVKPSYNRRLLLLNFRTGQLVEILSSADDLAEVATILIDNYLRGAPNISDADFLHNAHQATLNDAAVEASTAMKTRRRAAITTTGEGLPLKGRKASASKSRMVKSKKAAAAAEDEITVTKKKKEKAPALTDARASAPKAMKAPTKKKKST